MPLTTVDSSLFQVTGRVATKFGAPINTSGVITLGADGNAFHLTSSTGSITDFTHINGSGPFFIITDAVRTIVHSAGVLETNTGADITSAPGDRFRLDQDSDGTTWLITQEGASGASGAPASQLDLDILRSNLALNSFRIAVNGSLSLQHMVDGFVDEYVDETGIDTVNSVNQVYDAVADSYSPGAPVGVNEVPAMISNTAPSGVASASQALVGNDAFKAFDRLSGGNSWSLPANIFLGWLRYDFPAATVIVSYTIMAPTTPNRAPSAWRIEGSNDGTNWTILDTQSGQSFATSFLVKSYSILNVTAYINYRLNITSGGTTYTQIEEMTLIGQGVTNNITLQSTTQSALTQPTTGNIILFEEDVDAVTLNTDLMASVSRDGGTTWANALLVDKSFYANNLQNKTFVPIMTGYTTPSGTVTESTSNGSNRVGWHLFDGDTTTEWSAYAGGHSGWVAYTFTTPQTALQYAVTSGASTAASPKFWTFEGWNGTAWVVLDTPPNQNTWGTQQRRVFTIANPASYTGYRINISADNGFNNGVSFSALEFLIPTLTQKRVIQGSADISAQPAGTSMAYKITTANAKNLKLHGTSLGWK